jgi:hypothetical protein
VTGTAFSSTKAHGVSPHLVVRACDHGDGGHGGMLVERVFHLDDEMFSPPEMMMSLERSFSWI